VADFAVSVSEVSKRFLSHTERPTSLKERVVRGGRRASVDFWALRDVSIDVAHGETLGLIGANGSGKSTLLKIMAGILRPTSGTVHASGRIASLLELGAGFNGELSGRDNIYLNASLLGLTRRDIDAAFDEIVEFSELGEFIEGPVKHYSSGMYVRLGFAVAVHVEPDILLVDEVLAVGDEHFQRRCLDKIRDFQDQGRTILFVSHSSPLVEQVCGRAVVLDHGRIQFDGDPYFASAELSKILGTDVPDDKPDEGGDAELAFTGITFADSPGGLEVSEVAPGGTIAIRVGVTVGEHWVDQVDSARLVVMGVGDIPIWAMTVPAEELPRQPGDWVLDFIVPSCPSVRGRFVAAVQLSRDSGEALAITRSSKAFGISGTHKVGIMHVDYETRTSTGVRA
jgi:ABC-2 type transport system ATP-binding protein